MSNEKVLRLAIARPVKLSEGVVELEEALASPLIQSGALTVLEDAPPQMLLSTNDDGSLDILGAIKELSEEDLKILMESLAEFQPADIVPEIIGADLGTGDVTGTATIEVGADQNSSADDQSNAESDVDINLMTLEQAFEHLNPENPDHFTQTNKPEVRALAEILGRSVTAAERDEAWEAFQAKQAADSAGAE